MAENPEVPVEKEHDRSPALEVMPWPKQAALAAEGQQVIVVEQYWMVCCSQGNGKVALVERGHIPSAANLIY